VTCPAAWQFLRPMSSMAWVVLPAVMAVLSSVVARQEAVAAMPHAVLTPSKGKEKHLWVILDDDELSSDEDEPLQRLLQSSSAVSGSSGPTSTMVDVTAAAKATVDKEAVDKRAAEEAMVKEAMVKESTNKRAVKEAAMKEAADKEAAEKMAAEEAIVKKAADKEATDKRAAEEATVKEAFDKEATDKRAMEVVTVKEVAELEAADKEVVDKRAMKEATTKEGAVVAAGGSSASGQAPSSPVGTRRVATPSGSTPPAK
jgi:hypothetical protein